MNAHGDDPIDLSANENVTGAPPVALQAARAAVDLAHRYPERQDPELLRALAEKHRVDPDQILLGNGAQHVLRLIAATFIAPGDVAIGLDPSYPGYRSATTTVRGRYQAIAADPDGGYGDVTAWQKAAAGARLAWLCTPNNPTGGAMYEEEAEAVLTALPVDAIAVFDQTYRDFVGEERVVDGVARLRDDARVIVVHTFSKLYGLAGLRLGYCIADHNVIAEVRKRLDSFPVNRVAQAAALAALGDSAHSDRYRRLVRDGRSLLTRQLRELGVRTYPSQTNFVTALFGDRAPQVIADARAAGFVLRAMEGRWGLPGWVRITLGLPEHNRDVFAAIRRSLRASGS